MGGAQQFAALGFCLFDDGWCVGSLCRRVGWKVSVCGGKRKDLGKCRMMI